MSVQPRLAIAFWLTSVTLMPTISATRERAADDALAELARLRVLGVEVHRVGVHRQQREPGVVGLADRAAGPVLVDVADLEVLVVAAEGFAVAVLADAFWRSGPWVAPGGDSGTVAGRARASSAMRRALREHGASTMRPWKRKAPLRAVGRHRLQQRLAHSIRPAVGAKAAWIVLICCGWIAVLQPKPRASARRVSVGEASSLDRSTCGTSHACRPADLAALTRRPRALSRPVPVELGAELGREVGAAEHQRAELAAGARDLAERARCRAASRPAPRSRRSARRTTLRWPAGRLRVSVLGSSSQSTRDARLDQRERRRGCPRACAMPLTRSATPQPSAGRLGSSSASRAPGRALRPCGPGGRRLRDRCRPGRRRPPSPCAKRSTFSPETNSMERGWSGRHSERPRNVRTLCGARKCRVKP